QGGQVLRLSGVDGEGQQELFGGAAGQIEQRPQRVGLLAVEDAAVLDGTVAAPVADGGQRAVRDGRGGREGLQDDRRQRGGPAPPAGGHAAAGSADRLADGDEVSVAGQAHVDALGGVPELDEGRVEVEVDAPRDRGEEGLVGEHAGDVEQHGGAAGEGEDV